MMDFKNWAFSNPKITGVFLGLLIGIPLLVSIGYFLSSSNEPMYNFVEDSQETTLKFIRGNRSSRIYHLPECPNYNDISERNIINFQTMTEAEDKGFHIAGNCPPNVIVKRRKAENAPKDVGDKKRRKR